MLQSLKTGLCCGLITDFSHSMGLIQEQVSDIVDQGSFAELESVVAPRQIYTVEDILA